MPTNPLTAQEAEAKVRAAANGRIVTKGLGGAVFWWYPGSDPERIGDNWIDAASRIPDDARGESEPPHDAGLPAHLRFATPEYWAAQTFEPQPDYRTLYEQERALADELAAKLKWDLPLANLAQEAHRCKRVDYGHIDITAVRRSGERWVGLHQSEVDEIESAEDALAAYQSARNPTR